ncbi:MAG: hypothetical protein ACI4U0_00945 [Candidatus Aphodocola sp.]
MEFIKKEPIIILIAGCARSGKSTLAKYLEIQYQNQNKKVVISPYTKYLKKYIEEITGEKINEEKKPRDLLQQISSKLIKGILHKKDFFINRQIEDIEIYSYFMDVVIIPDVRFPEEIEEVKAKFSNVVSIGVIRMNYVSDLTEEQKKDITEISLDRYHDYDFEIENKDGLDLQKKALEIIQKIEERRLEDE